MKTQKTELIVGIFVLTGLFLLAGLIIFFGKAVRLGKNRYEVSAIFENIHGMARGTPVRYLGIDIGELAKTGFTEKGDKVRLVLSIGADYNIPADAMLTVRPTGILGDYYLEFARGNPETGYLKKDGTAVVKGEPMITIDEVVSKLTDFTGKLEQHLDNLGGNLTELSGSLNKILGDEQFRKDIKLTVAEAPDAVRAFKDMTTKVTATGDQIHDLVGRMKQAVEKLDTQVDRQGENFDKLTTGLRKSADAVNQTLASLDEILRRFNEGKGTIGSLVKKDDMHEKLVKAVDQMNEALIEIRKMAEAIRRKWGR